MLFTFARSWTRTAAVPSNPIRNLVGATMASPAHKKLTPTVKIGTHGGKFHCDEVLAVYLLKQLPEYKHADVVRTRDPEVLKTCDIVVDVGAVYDPTTHRYDHHQRGFNETMNSLKKDKPWTIKLSSAGLVYCHFGMEILKVMDPLASEDENFLAALYDLLYTQFVMEIDAIDNGIPMFDGEPRYNISTNISARVGNINPPWNAPEVDEGCLTYFNQAMDLVGREFKDRVNYYSTSWWPARSIVLDAIENRFKIHESGAVIELTTSCPWKEHLFDLIEKLNIKNGDIKFVVFLNTSSKLWYVMAVSITRESFVCHRFLLEPWRGIRDEELSKITGIENCTFVHANGFIGGNKTREGAIQMAIKAVEAGKQPDDGKL